MVISLMYLLKMMKETIRPNTNSVFMFAMSQSFLLLRCFEDKKEKPFFADYFICCNFDKNTCRHALIHACFYERMFFLFPLKKYIYIYKHPRKFVHAKNLSLSHL